MQNARRLSVLQKVADLRRDGVQLTSSFDPESVFSFNMQLLVTLDIATNFLYQVRLTFVRGRCGVACFVCSSRTNRVR